MKILLSGICGYMGREVVNYAKIGYRGAVLVGGIDRDATGAECVPTAKSFAGEDFTPEFLAAVKEADCIIDFTHHSCTPALLDFAVDNNIPVVLCTTGQTEDETAKIAEAAKVIPVFHSANMSLGVALLVELAKKTAAAMPEAEIEIIEKHHNRKLDAPSGTALMIADAIREVRPNAKNHCGRSGHGKRAENEIGIHAIRMGNIVGEHEVIVGTAAQTITLKHEAHSRALFAEGAIVAADYICGRPAGLYKMDDMVK